MNLTTVNVAIAVQLLVGVPLPGGSVRFELTKADINGAVVLPRAVTVALPADGSTATAQLWPNSLGTQGSQTKVTILDQAGVEQFSGLARIPPTNCNLHDVLNLQPPPSLTDAQAALQAVQALLVATQGAQLTAWAAAQAFTVTSATRNSDGAITTASIVWPDGVTGTYTADALSTVFAGATDAWHATYASSIAKTITQAAVTRDANGAVIAQPALTIT